MFKAKSLKNNQNFQGVSITHDLTKRQCQAEKVREMDLRREAEEKNCHLSENEKSDKVWKVVGGRGTRRVVLRDSHAVILHHNSAKHWNWDTHRESDTHWITDTNQELGHALELRTCTDISSQTQMAEKNEKNDNFVPLESKYL